jgi:CDI immunity proteins
MLRLKNYPFGKSRMEQTLEQLENDVWDSSEIMSTLSDTCHRLRKKPIDQFTVEDLRIMLGQDIGTEYLMPKALNVLELNPLADGDFYAGDLLKSLLKLPEEYWKEHPENTYRARKIVANAIKMLREQEDLSSVYEKLIEKAENFLAKTSI